MAGLASVAQRGVRGALEACFDAEGRVSLRTRSPLELRGPFARDGGPLYYLRNVTTGIFAGDRYEVSLRTLPGAGAQIASSSATKAYTSLEAPACVSTRIEALPGSRIVWGPHATILQAGASLSQHTAVMLHETSSVVCAEVLSFGRIALGERLRFARYESEFVVSSPDKGPLYEERYVLQPNEALESALSGNGALESALSSNGALVCVYVLGEGAIASADLEDRLSDYYAGSSALPNGAGYVVKALVASVSAGMSLCEAVLSRYQP